MAKISNDQVILSVREIKEKTSQTVPNELPETSKQKSVINPQTRAQIMIKISTRWWEI